MTNGKKLKQQALLKLKNVKSKQVISTRDSAKSLRPSRSLLQGRSKSSSDDAIFLHLVVECDTTGHIPVSEPLVSQVRIFHYAVISEWIHHSELYNLKLVE